VVAEGVETAQQLAILRMSHCDFLQGYLLCKPLPADSFLFFTLSTMINGTCSPHSRITRRVMNGIQNH
jgi:EAL domain-containing protein (putative c-di-GMP-specific phosphodiesterase class I)